MLDKKGQSDIITIVVDAALAHPVERHLAKVEVASSSLVSRSIEPVAMQQVLFIRGYDGIGRHARFRFSC